MIGLLIQFLMLMIVLGVIYFVAKLIVGALELPAVIIQIVGIVIVLIAALWLLSVLGAMTGGGDGVAEARVAPLMTVDEEIRDLKARIARMEALIEALTPVPSPPKEAPPPKPRPRR